MSTFSGRAELEILRVFASYTKICFPLLFEELFPPLLELFLMLSFLKMYGTKVMV